MSTCKHGNTGHCDLCNREDDEHDAAMAAQALDDRDELATLREAYAAAKIDAKRYRWLRENGEPDAGMAYRADWLPGMYDAAVDAAMLAAPGFGDA